MVAKKNGLGSIGNLSTLLDDDKGNGQPLELDISLIDDDPNNREDVSDSFLHELTEDIKVRGVKAPISVRTNPSDPSRYMVNDGHNRRSCSIKANKKTIPSFIDNDFDEFDQMKANLLSAKVSSKDFTTFIKRKLDDGMKKGDIAKRLGKSPSLISQHITLLNLPDVVQNVFDAGRCEDVTVINELVKLENKHSQDVSTWLNDEEQEITRSSLKLLNEFIDYKEKSGNEEHEEKPTAKKTKTEDDPDKFKKAIVQLEYQGRPARIILTQRPTNTGLGWIKFDDDGDIVEILLSNATITELIES